jgi:hypothetical protein
LQPGGTLGIGDANGITTFPNATGNIQNLNRIYNSGANYTYNGTAAQVTGNALPTPLSGNLTINNSAGVTLSQTTTHNGTLTLTNGILATGANTLAIGGGAIVNRTNGYVNGNLQRTFNAAGSLTFDVGTTNGYSPVAVNATAGTFPATFIVKATQGGMPGVSGTNKLARYWTLTNSTVTSANLTFTYLASDVTGTVANYQFIKDSGGTLSVLAPTGTPTSTSATINGVTSFSDWTLAEPSAIQYGSFQFSSATYNVSETAGTATITVNRTGGADSAVSVDYATVAGGTATGGATCVGAPTFTDYLTTSGTLSFAAGETSKTFDVTICNEIAYEPNDTVNLQLSNAQGGATLGSPTDSTLTINSEDAAPTIGITDVTAAEGNAGTTNFTFNIFRTGSPSQDPINIAYHTADGSAVAPGDYTAVGSGNATIAAFGPSVNVTISVNGDTTLEPNETFTVELDSTSVGTIADASGLGTITNDDTAESDASVSGGVLTVSDGNGGTSNDALTLSRNGANVRINDPGNTISAGTGATQVDANTVDVPFASLTSIQVNTLGGNDALTLALAGGNVIPSGGLAYAGGAQTTSDKLSITGGTQGNVTYNYTNANDGSVVMQNFGTVSYTGLEPISNSGTASNIIFNLPAGPNAVTLADDGTGGNTLSRLSGATFETTDFANPTGSLTLNRGNASDTLTVGALPDFNAALTLGTGGNPFSTIDFTGGVTLAADKDLDAAASGTISLSGAAADLATTGIGEVHLITARNISLTTGSSVTVVDGMLLLTANNIPSPTSGDFNGVDIIGATVQTTGNGFVNVTGRGGSGDFTENFGVQLAAGGQILGTNNTSDIANMSIHGIGGEGIGGATAGSSNTGVYVTGNNSLIHSTSAIQVTGEGGATNNSGSYGVVVDGLGKLQVSGPGALTVNGTGGLVTGGGATFVNSAGIFVVAGNVPTEGGSIVSTGTGANAGNINLIGIADNGGAGAAQGVRVDAPGTVTSVDGAINIDGTAAPCAISCLGTSIRGLVTATGTGAINLTGTGANITGAGSTHGVNVRSGGNVVATNGDITVTGTGGNGTDNAGFNLAPSGGGILQIAVTGTGDITVNADTIRINPVAGSATITAGASNAVTLRQKTNGVALNLGSVVDSTASTLELSDGELDRVISTGTLNLGDTNSGAITVSASISRAASTVLNLTSGANIDIATGSLSSGGGNVTLTPNTNVFPSNSGVDVTTGAASTLALTSAKDLKIVINNTTVDTGYTQLNVAGLVNLNNANLALSGAHVPAAGQSFIIVNNDGADAITGTFNGLAEGATIPSFLGSALNAKITYVGGDGNDAVITVQSPPKYRSRQSGNWNDFNTWQVDTGGGFVNAIAGQTPTSADDTIQIQSPHTVTVTASVSADQLTVDSGGTLSVSGGVTFTIADGAGTDMTVNGTVATAGNITNNGQAIVNNTLQIEQGGFPGGGTGTYTYDQVNATLVFNNTSGSFGVNNVNFWPAANGPQNVNVQGAGGITMNVARTVGLLFQYAAGVSGANNLTLNGTSQVNAGGFTSGSPTYGASSLLKYNVNAAYGRNGEWLPNATSGAGYPANVQLSNNTNLDLPNGSAGVFFQMSGTLTIDAGSTMNLNGSPAMTQPLIVGLSVVNLGTLNLSSASGGDIKVGFDWRRGSSATFNPNGRAVFFNGTGNQTIRVVGGGIETFSYFIVDKPSGSVRPDDSNPTNIIVNGTGGDVLQILNAGGIDLNGQGFTMQGAGGNVLVSGGARTIDNSSGTPSTFNFTGSKSVTSAAGGTLTFGANVNVSLFQAVDFGALLSTIDGTLTIGGGGSVNTNPPTYGPFSTLVYDCVCVYGRGAEWSATSGPGYPNNVTVNGSTDVNIGSGSPATARQIAGTLDAKSGGRFLMDFPGNEMTAALTVLSNVLIEGGGSLNLSTATGGDLKVQGNFTNSGTFTPNNRAVFFEGAATQNLTDSSGTATMPYVRVNKGGGTVLLQSNLTSLAPSGGDSIQFLGTSNTVTLNGKTLTLGSTIGTPPAGSGLIGDTAASLSLQDGGTGPGNAMGTFAFVSGSQALGNLTLNRTGASGSATLGSDLTLQSALALTAGVVNTGSFVLTHNGTSTGNGDVVGNVRRTDLGLTARSFGNPNNRISFTTGTAPTEITVNLVKTQPTGPGFGYPNAVQRTYTITPTGGSGFTATLRLHYLDAELNGNTEALLDFWRFNGTVWQRVVKTPVVGQDLINNWIESNVVTQFSPWTLAQGNALTESRLASFSATQYDGGTVLSWKTGFEVDNLGFNLYREVGGRRTLVNSSLIAGSALVAGPKVALTAGNSYIWTDYVGGAGALYYLEELDLNGGSKTYGPYTPTRGGGRLGKGGRSPVLSGLTDGAVPTDTQHQWTRTDAARAELTRGGTGPASAAAEEKQRWLAAQPSVKIAVRAAGWYHVAREQLTVAGLSPAADPARLQLYAGGIEVPIRVGADGSIEFYGQGLDVQSTDTRVYWLVEGDTAGLRTSAAGGAAADTPVSTGGGEETDGGQANGTSVINIVPIDPSPQGPEFFNYTVERRDRTVYFSGLQNGEAENFFGKVVNATAATQTLTARNLLQQDAQSATLEVSLQGLTAGEHHVSVSFNGADLGTLDFAGQTNKTATFQVEGYMLHEGDNQVQLVSAGSGDVSLTDRLRLTYQHSLNADDDRLRFNVPAGPVRVGGFSTPGIRVIDVTNPAAPFEVQLGTDAVLDAQGRWSIAFNANAASGERELFAFADTQTTLPVSVLANTPSAWSADAGQQADMVVVTHGDFAQQLAPLVAARAAEGMNVKVVNVEDLFDEFSYGAHTPQAVRDFLAWTKAHWTKAPAYLLLVGDGSYDPRDYLGRGRYDLVPSKLVDAGAMETASDDWFADFDDDGIADLAVGRLPVRTPAEASTVVGKIVSRTFDPAQTSALMVADRDGPDGYNFEVATDGVQSLLPLGTSVSRVNRRAQDAATVRSQILAGVNAGPTVVNWMGHGSIDVWTGDGLLRGADAPLLQNGSRLPLFVMMTCLNGYYEGTGLDSLAEAVLKAQQGGAYAVWASSGMTEPNAQLEANRELYRIIFAEADTVRLGDAVRRAKTATADRDVRRTWVFFGDPSSRLR